MHVFTKRIEGRSRLQNCAARLILCAVARAVTTGHKPLKTKIGLNYIKIQFVPHRQCS